MDHQKVPIGSGGAIESKDAWFAVLQFHRGSKVIALEDFVTSVQKFELVTYEGKLTYKDARIVAQRFFKHAAERGLARYRLGRRGKPTRLIWKIDPLRYLEPAAETDPDLREIMQASVDESAYPVHAGLVDQPAIPATPSGSAGPPAPPLTHSDIADDVRRALREASKGKGTRPQLLTAYQILDRIPQRDQLIRERGMPGREAGVHHAAASVVRDSIRYDLKNEVEVEYFDNVGVVFEVGGNHVRAGFPVCGLYRLRDEASAEV